MLIVAVFLISASTLAFEVLLARVFSISQWNHLSFMVISIALFGFAASGTFLNLLDARKKDGAAYFTSRHIVRFCVLFFTLTTLASFLILNRIPLDYFQLLLDPAQFFYFLAVYLFLSLPFFFSGLILSIAYAFRPEKSGLIYFASMAGSACGALTPALLLPFFGEGRLIILSALTPLFVILFYGQENPIHSHIDKSTSHGKHSMFWSFGTVMLCMAAVLFFFKNETVRKIKPSPYKRLAQTLQYPGTRIAETFAGIRGQIDRIQSPHIRFAPGLSLKFAGLLPDQEAIFKDADNPLFLYYPSFRKNEPFSKFTLTYSGYLFRHDPENVLLIQNGGGLAVPCATASGARNITIVEQNPHISQIMHRHYKIPVANQNPRTFLARTAKQFDIIHVENWSSSFLGSTALSQDHLFTLQAFTEYLNHLSPNGVLIVSRVLLLPPADSIRLWATAYQSLKSLGIEYPEKHLVLLRNWDTFTLLVSKSLIKDTAAIKSFAKHLNFDIVFIHDITPDETNRFSVFDQPYHFLEISRLAQAFRSGRPNRYFQTYLLETVPQTDNRPFPGKILKWSALKRLYKTTGSRLYGFMLSGELIVAVVFVEALLVAFFLLALPILFISKNTPSPSIYQILYFLSVGGGFIFVELFFIKKYILLFGDPIISLTVVLSGILVFSGIGGYCSSRFKRRGLYIGLIALMGVLAGLFFCIDPFIKKLFVFSDRVQYALALLLLFPPAFLMGLPFPLGIQFILKNPSQRAYGWSANGCASVLASIISAQIALSHGISAIMIFAFFSYLLVFLSVYKNKTT